MNEPIDDKIIYHDGAWYKLDNSHLALWSAGSSSTAWKGITINWAEKTFTEKEKTLEDVINEEVDRLKIRGYV